MKVGIMSFDRQTADIYLTAEMVICERGRSKAAPVFPPLNLFIQALLNMLMKLAVSDVCGAAVVTRLHGRADGGRCRRQTLDIQQET